MCISLCDLKTNRRLREVILLAIMASTMAPKHEVQQLCGSTLNVPLAATTEAKDFPCLQRQRIRLLATTVYAGANNKLATGLGLGGAFFAGFLPPS